MCCKLRGFHREARFWLGAWCWNMTTILQVLIAKTMLTTTLSFLGVTIITFSFNMAWATSLWRQSKFFMVNGITNETTVNDGIGFVFFSATSFVTGFISCTTKLGQNSIHYYFFFILKFIVWVVWIPMAMLLGMSQFIAFTIDHICLPSFASILLLGGWFHQFLVFVGISHIFFTNDCSFFMFE